jgi:hemoglobin
VNILNELDPKAASITENSIRVLIDRFYDKVRADPELGPIFARAIPGDWGPHLATMRNFWSSVMLTTGRYKGNPVAKHLAVAGIKPQLFERWLNLFGETCSEQFDESVARQFRMKALRIAESLKLALFYRPDRPWPNPAPEPNAPRFRLSGMELSPFDRATCLP